MENNMKNLLIVDVSSVIWKAVYVNQYLMHNRQYTGGLYGAFIQLRKCIELYNIDNIIFCFDNPPYLRRQGTDYKSDRKKVDEILFKKVAISKKLIKDFCEMFSFPIIDEPGFEADDGIAFITQYYHKKFKNLFILSQDSDLYQLLTTDNIALVKKDSLYGKQQFKNEFSINVSDWVRVLCLMGTHNNVKGIKGVGIKTALKLMKDKERHAKVYTEHQSMLELKESLIVLPHAKFPSRRYKILNFEHKRKGASNPAIITVGKPPLKRGLISRKM